MALANYGFGEPLCSAARSLPPNQFRNYLFEWRTHVCDFLRTDPVSSMGSRHKALATAMPDDFPNPEIVYLYLFPKTSPSAMTSTVHEHHLPDITQITQLCELYFPWATAEDIFVKFEASVFPAVFISVLRDQVVRREQGAHGSIQVSEVCARTDFLSLFRLLTTFA
jgi:Holliday junction resolvase YEN1